MPVKCRSCGHLNKDEVKSCERCGCDLRYSLLFDTVIRNRGEESQFLFPLNVPGEEEETIFPETGNDLDTGETILPESRPHVEESPVFRQRKTGSARRIGTELQENAGQLLVTYTAEVLLFMILFLIVSMIARIAAPEFVFQNWRLGVVSLFYYGFATVSSWFFAGRTAASFLLAGIIH
ncbi:MAG: zinc ribbon domain-containing protein [Acidobacteria bacterium]|nr:zinc ribbon domain-containing protein [Acidobacteriota bacterium]